MARARRERRPSTTGLMRLVAVCALGITALRLLLAARVAVIHATTIGVLAVVHFGAPRRERRAWTRSLLALFGCGYLMIALADDGATLPTSRLLLGLLARLQPDPGADAHFAGTPADVRERAFLLRVRSSFENGQCLIALAFAALGASVGHRLDSRASRPGPDEP